MIEAAPGCAAALLGGVLTVAGVEAAVLLAWHRLGLLWGGLAGVAAMASFAAACAACGGVDRWLLSLAARRPAM